ncbi:hypothetical protein J3A84_02420 [Proteiniclasticum sp. SCR006]|uniref:Uncharacterized protein n=1 Tax=Proteiniclasticum aestuarii TaxID=2817862 RepID=A0A939H8F4_9CLOT|nr:hypothetical protein [Proteiniclasticum aestuarii]MBO1263898.1 hypothetical protein [Proteiniclasticum aestuarii]
MELLEIRKDLLKFVQTYYKDSEIRHLDVPKGEIELQFSFTQNERMNILRFFEDNIHIFTEYTEDTRKDIMEISEIFIRFDGDGLYFGKSGFDYTASNAAAYYVLNRYLDEMVEELPGKMNYYKENYLYQ